MFSNREGSWQLAFYSERDPEHPRPAVSASARSPRDVKVHFVSADQIQHFVRFVRGTLAECASVTKSTQRPAAHAAAIAVGRLPGGGPDATQDWEY